MGESGGEVAMVGVCCVCLLRCGAGQRSIEEGEMFGYRYHSMDCDGVVLVVYMS